MGEHGQVSQVFVNVLPCEDTYADMYRVVEVFK